jgi:hypothetical protein
VTERDVMRGSHSESARSTRLRISWRVSRCWLEQEAGQSAAEFGSLRRSRSSVSRMIRMDSRTFVSPSDQPLVRRR